MAMSDTKLEMIITQLNWMNNDLEQYKKQKSKLQILYYGVVIAIIIGLTFIIYSGIEIMLFPLGKSTIDANSLLELMKIIIVSNPLLVLLCCILILAKNPIDRIFTSYKDLLTNIKITQASITQLKLKYTDTKMKMDSKQQATEEEQ